MKFKNKKPAIYVGFKLAGGDPHCPKIGIPIRLEKGEVGEFEVVNRSTEIAVRGGILSPYDKDARDWWASIEGK